jgi:hypothetical protein
METVWSSPWRGGKGPIKHSHYNVCGFTLSRCIRSRTRASPNAGCVLSVAFSGPITDSPWGHSTVHKRAVGPGWARYADANV